MQTRTNRSEEKRARRAPARAKSRLPAARSQAARPRRAGANRRQDQAGGPQHTGGDAREDRNP